MSAMKTECKVTALIIIVVLCGHLRHSYGRSL